MSFQIPPRAFAIPALLLALSWAAPAAARVFRRIGGVDHGATTAGRPGWTRAYRTELEINGGRGEMEVLGVTLPLAAALDTLRATYEGLGGEAFFSSGDAVGWGVARIGDRIVRVLAIAVEGPRECLVFRFEQPRDQFERSMREAPGAAAAIAVPGARARRTVVDAENALTTETVETNAGPAETAAAIERALLAEGWLPALPGAPGAGLFLRGPEVIAVRVAGNDAPGGGARATILRKRMGGL